jgi:hypothetical protein
MVGVMGLLSIFRNNLSFDGFVGLNLDETAWGSTVFTKNRDRLSEGDSRSN